MNTSQKIIDEAKRRLILEARNKYKTIFPAGKRETLEESFTLDKDLLIFWFNTSFDDSTHNLHSHLCVVGEQLNNHTGESLKL